MALPKVDMLGVLPPELRLEDLFLCFLDRRRRTHCAASHAERRTRDMQAVVIRVHLVTCDTMAHGKHGMCSELFWSISGKRPPCAIEREGAFTCYDWDNVKFFLCMTLATFFLCLRARWSSADVLVIQCHYALDQIDRHFCLYKDLTHFFRNL